MLLWERTGTIPVRGEEMLNLSKVVQQLKTEREQTRAKLNRLETALKILLDMELLDQGHSRRATSTKQINTSAAARERIAATQRAR